MIRIQDPGPISRLAITTDPILRRSLPAVCLRFAHAHEIRPKFAHSKP